MSLDLAMRQRIVDTFGQSVLQRSAMRIREGAGAFERFMHGQGIRTAVEIGTFRGVSSAVMSQHCERLVTYDLIDGMLENAARLNRGKDVKQAYDDFDRRAFWNALGCHNIELVLVKDDAAKARSLESLDFDFAFVDGAHDERVAFDFNLVKKCGRVLFHDVDVETQNNFVSRFLATLPQNELEFYDIYCMWRGARDPAMGAGPIGFS